MCSVRSLFELTYTNSCCCIILKSISNITTRLLEEQERSSAESERAESHDDL
jgi:hypothetical protein